MTARRHDQQGGAAIETHDRVVIGAGAFGMAAAATLAGRGLDVLLVDGDPTPFRRASTVNQARLHLGYHYPRSVRTARAARDYFVRFKAEFPQTINEAFTKVYAIARHGSHTTAEAFERFCRAQHLPLTPLPTGRYFDARRVTGVWETMEHSIDPDALAAALRARCDAAGVTTVFGDGMVAGDVTSDEVLLELRSGRQVRCERVVNATYANINGVLSRLELPSLSLEHELCEIALVEVPERLRDVGFTVMDGPFFSLMPYGHTGLHSLTAVAHTPRRRASGLPSFACQTQRRDCVPTAVAECTECRARPVSGFVDMAQLAQLYLAGSGEIRHVRSLMTVKTVLSTAAVDDARPSMVVEHDENARVTTVFSGKLNTLFDVEALR